MIDDDGYRKNVGIVVCNQHDQVLWAQRVRRDGWQFPQGGVKLDESVIDATYRELHEEVGLQPHDVKLLGTTDDWLKYEVPFQTKVRALYRTPKFRGQKQRWFLFRLISDESCIRLDVSDIPEFAAWKWVDYWQPLQDIIAFKREVYKQMLTELEPSMRK